MSAPESESPFVLHLLHLEEGRYGSFRPGVRVALSPVLRSSGLLLALPGEDLKRLLLIMTFATPNGHVQPSLVELAQSLRQPQGVTRMQLRRLERFQWHGSPLLHELRRESGLHAFAPSPRILRVEKTNQNQPEDDSDVQVAAGREAVIAHSRRTYARPRDEVEREIARVNRWEWPPRTLAERQALLQTGQIATPTNDNSMHEQPPIAPASGDTLDRLRHDLASWGIPSDLVERLLADYGAERIRQQLDWLPYRKAAVPGRLLVAAIQKDYAPPAAIRARMALEHAVKDAVVPVQTARSDAEEIIELPIP